MEFDEFLKSKKIDPTLFKKGDEATYLDFKNLFEQVHPNSFVQQKLFLINKIRRTYQLKEDIEKATRPTPQKRPVIKPKPKLN